MGLAILRVTSVYDTVACTSRVIGRTNLRNLHAIVSHLLARLSLSLDVLAACHMLVLTTIRHIQRQRQSCQRVRSNSMKVGQVSTPNHSGGTDHGIVDQGDANKSKYEIRRSRACPKPTPRSDALFFLRPPCSTMPSSVFTVLSLITLSNIYYVASHSLARLSVPLGVSDACLTSIF